MRPLLKGQEPPLVITLKCLLLYSVYIQRRVALPSMLSLYLLCMHKEVAYVSNSYSFTSPKNTLSNNFHVLLLPPYIKGEPHSYFTRNCLNPKNRETSRRIGTLSTQTFPEIAADTESILFAPPRRTCRLPPPTAAICPEARSYNNIFIRDRDGVDDIRSAVNRTLPPQSHLINDTESRYLWNCYGLLRQRESAKLHTKHVY